MDKMNKFENGNTDMASSNYTLASAKDMRRMLGELQPRTTGQEEPAHTGTADRVGVYRKKVEGNYKGPIKQMSPEQLAKVVFPEDTDEVALQKVKEILNKLKMGKEG